MFKLAFTAVVAFGCGVLLMDTLYRPEPKPRWTMQQPYADPLRLTPPVQCDATVNGKCYIRGLK